MKNIWFSYSICIVLITGFLGLLIWYFKPFSNAQANFSFSPLPDFLNLTKNNQVSTLNIWLPKENYVYANANKPEVNAKSALTYDLSANKILFSKNPKERLPIASLTKVMTAVIAMENKKQDDRYVVSEKSLVGEDSMGLSNGEILSLKELLYGLMLPSGNDAAEVLAENSLGRDKFIEAMNEKAKSLGIKDTNFTNPSGLQGDGIQYSTVYDLLVITNYALSNFPVFQEVVKTFEINIPATETHKQYYLHNETNLLTSYPGVKGVKTGYTPEAELCLITYLDYKGHKIIGIILGSNNRREEMKELLDYSLKALGETPPPHS